MPDAPDQRPVFIELLKQKQNEAFGVIKYYEAAVTAYLLITGGLLKFALDKDATVELRQALELMGLAVSGVGFLAAVLAERHRRIVREQIRVLFDGLLLPSIADNLVAQKYGIISALSIFVIGCAGWCVLLTM